MVIEIVTVVGAWFAVLIVSTIIGAGMFGLNTFANTAWQAICMVGLAAVLFHYGLVGVIGAAVIVASIVAIKLVGVVFIALYSYRALKGSLGDEAQWAAEFIKEGDEEFTRAMTALPSQELKEARIIAESKEELREITIERYEEYND